MCVSQTRLLIRNGQWANAKNEDNFGKARHGTLKICDDTAEKVPFKVAPLR